FSVLLARSDSRARKGTSGARRWAPPGVTDPDGARRPTHVRRGLTIEDAIPVALDVRSAALRFLAEGPAGSLCAFILCRTGGALGADRRWHESDGEHH